MGQKHKKVFKKHTRKLRFKRREKTLFILEVKYIHRWRKLKELVSSLEEDAIKKKFLDLLASFEDD